MYVTGISFGGLELVNPIEGFNGGMGDVFILQLAEANNVPSLVFSTYLGEIDDEDWGRGITVDNQGSIYVTGHTQSSDFDTVNPIEGDSGGYDVFVTKIDADAPVPLAIHNDFNADEISDLLSVDSSDGDIGTALLEDSVIQSNGEFLQLNPSEGWTVNATGDFNGDLKADLLLFNTVTGAVGVARVDGTTLIDGVVVHTLNAAGGEVTRGVGDFDGDGKAEIIVQNLNTGDLSFLFLDGDTVSSNEAVGQIDTSWSLLRTGDFNGDRKSDLLFMKASTGEVAIVEMDGSTIAQATIAFTLGSGWVIVDTGDFDGGDFSDVLAQNLSGDVAVIFIQNSAIKSTEILGTLREGWQIINAGNYNADNLADLLIQDRVTGDLLTVILKGISPGTHIITNLGPLPTVTVHSGKP